MKPAVYPGWGYTLIELLIVISIMAILGVIGFVGFKNFAEDQILTKAVGVVQTVLRLAQSNATAGTFCNGSGGAIWRVKFEDPLKLDLICALPIATPPVAYTLRSYNLENAKVLSITSSACSSPPPIFPGYYLFVNYSPLSGKVDFYRADGNNSCINGNQSIPNPTLTIELQNTKNNKTKKIILSKGGSIDVQ